MADPITLPNIPWSQVDFTPISPVSVSRMEGRRTEEMSFATPYWVASYATGTLLPAQSGLFDAFMMKADARGSHFLAYDVWRPRPIAMNKGLPLSGTKAVGGAFNGVATLQAITNSRTIVVSGLPAGFILSPGDYVEIRQTALKRSLHRVAEPATSNGSGVVTVSILYDLDTQNFSTSAAVNFERPSCVMMLDPGSVQASKSLSSRDTSFSATEVFPYEP